jgi:hypothetical protein
MTARVSYDLFGRCLEQIALGGRDRVDACLDRTPLDREMQDGRGPKNAGDRLPVACYVSVDVTGEPAFNGETVGDISAARVLDNDRLLGEIKLRYEMSEKFGTGFVRIRCIVPRPGLTGLDTAAASVCVPLNERDGRTDPTHAAPERHILQI